MSDDYLITTYMLKFLSIESLKTVGIPMTVENKVPDSRPGYCKKWLLKIISRNFVKL